MTSCLEMWLIEEGAEFEDAGANGLERHVEREGGSFVDEKNDTVELTFTGAAGQDEADGMKEVAAANIEFFLEEGNDFLEAIGVEGRGVQEEKSEFADDVAGRVAGEDGVSFGSLQGVSGVVDEHETEEMFEASAVESEMTEERSGAFGKGKMFGRRLGSEPGLLAKEGENVIAGEGIDMRAVLSNVIVW